MIDSLKKKKSRGCQESLKIFTNLCMRFHNCGIMQMRIGRIKPNTNPDSITIAKPNTELKHNVRIILLKLVEV